MRRREPVRGIGGENSRDEERTTYRGGGEGGMMWPCGAEREGASERRKEREGEMGMERSRD